MISSNNNTVWVFDSEGNPLGCFGLAYQKKSGRCLHFNHATDLDWEIFKAEMLRLYQVVVGDEFKP